VDRLDRPDRRLIECGSSNQLDQKFWSLRSTRPINCRVFQSFEPTRR